MIFIWHIRIIGVVSVIIVVVCIFQFICRVLLHEPIYSESIPNIVFFVFISLYVSSSFIAMSILVAKSSTSCCCCSCSFWSICLFRACSRSCSSFITQRAISGILVVFSVLNSSVLKMIVSDLGDVGCGISLWVSGFDQMNCWIQL